MALHAKDVERAWGKLKMDTSNTGDRHAIFRYGGKIILRTKRSFGSGKIEGNIPHLIRQQMKLNERQFKDLIDCPLSRDDYIDLLRQKGLIAPGVEEEDQER